MRVLVTGGAGFIGSHIVDQLIARGHVVTVLDNLSTGRLENIHLNADFIRVDVTDSFLARKLSGRRFDAVVHHAAQVSVPRSLDDPLFDARVNLVGTMNMLEFACQAHAQRFIFASSAAVYGNPATLPISEDAPARPRSPYATSKRAAEEYLIGFKCPAGLSATILRYANIYGPRQSAQGEAGVVCAFIHQILSGKTPLIYGDGDQTRDFVHVNDVAAANLLALRPDAPSGTYNVGSGQPTRIRDLLDLLIGASSPRAFAEPRSGDVRHSALDNTAIRSRLGWQPSISLVEGLTQTWRYFVNHLDAPTRRIPALVSAPFNSASAY